MTGFGGPEGRIPSTPQHSFANIPAPRLGRSKFDRSKTRKMTFDSGFLVPFFVDPVVPGDTSTINVEMFCRVATPEVPVMDNWYAEWFFFYVPNRIVWSNWNRFLGERDPNPSSSISYLIPVATSPVGGYAFGSLQDHIGKRPGVANVTTINLVERGYNKIWNWYFRDENLQDSVTVPMGDGPDTPADYVLLPRGKRHDYITSCLPFQQKGSAAVIPLGSTAPIVALNAIANSTVGGQALRWTNVTSGAAVAGPEGVGINADGTTRTYTGSVGAGTQLAPRNLFADLSLAVSASVPLFRQSVAIQHLLERDARGGTRADEIVNAHFGVVVPDYRLDQPEYLGGGSQRINFIPIPQTSETGAGTPQANLAAAATLSAEGGGFTKSFVEHGFVIGLLAVRADLTYQQGTPRWAFLRSREEMYWPDLAHLSEQAVLNQEVFTQGTSADTDVFGYIPRYDEMRFGQNEITGIFRSDAPASLDVMHSAEDFSALPVLNDTFIQDKPPISRSLAVTSEPQFMADIAIRHIHARPLPVRGIPGLTRL